VAPGLALGFIVAPLRLRESIMASVAPADGRRRLRVRRGQRLMDDGTARTGQAQRADAQRRQQTASERLAASKSRPTRSPIISADVPQPGVRRLCRGLRRRALR